MTDPTNPHEKGRTLPLGGASTSASGPAPGAPLTPGRAIPPYVPAPPPGVAVQLPGSASGQDHAGHAAHAQAGPPGQGKSVPPAPQRLTRSDELMNTGGKTMFEFDGRHAQDPHRPPEQRTFAPGTLEIHPDEQIGRGESNLRSGSSTWILVAVAAVVIAATWGIAALRPDPVPPGDPTDTAKVGTPAPPSSPTPVPEAKVAATDEGKAEAGAAVQGEDSTAAKSAAEKTASSSQPAPVTKPKPKPKTKRKTTTKQTDKKKVILKPKKPPREPENDFDGLPKPPA